MENKKVKTKKTFVIASAIAAAAALTVSVGAAADWDIASLFMTENASERDEHAELSEKTIREYYESENFTVHGVSAETEYEILQSLSHEIDRDFEVGGYHVHVTGYAYDGNWLELLYEVKFDGGVPDVSGGIYPFPVSIEPASYDSRFNASGWNTKITQITEDTVKYRSYHDVNIPEDIGIRLFVAEDNDRLTVFEKGMSYASGNFVDVELNGKNEYSYSADVDFTVNGEYSYNSIDQDESTGELVQILHEGEYVLNVKNVRISPFGIVMKGISSEKNSVGLELPLIAVFNDGSAIDISGKMGGARSGIADGMYEFTASYASHGVLLDAREITELRIGDTIIPING